MLHRAARNAYSWWWASHIRTKQSKWLDENLQDMEEKVEYVLKIIDEDGESFAKRAEMYYRRRPELLNFVEDFFRSYRALAERFDHLSKDLQTANRTIATVYPERVQLAMEDEDGEQFLAELGPPKESNEPSKSSPAAPKLSFPKVPSFAKRNAKPSRLMSKKGLIKFNVDDAIAAARPRSGLKKSEALQEIDKLQKDILALQTEKEFIKSSYDNGLAKYWEIEERVTELQSKVSSLQDEFGIGTMIEDDEARSLMTATALNSCQETLARLQEKQKHSVEDVIVEHRKILEVLGKFETLKGKFVSRLPHPQVLSEVNKSSNPDSELKLLNRQVETSEREKHNEEKVHKELEASSTSSMSDLAEKVDELVDKVINLETAFSSQNAYVNRLRAETNELHSHLTKAEEEKGTLVEYSESMSKRIRQLEEELLRVQNVNESFSFDDLSDKLHNNRQDKDVKDTFLSNKVINVSGVDKANQFQAHGAIMPGENVLGSSNDVTSKECLKKEGLQGQEDCLEVDRSNNDTRDGKMDGSLEACQGVSGVDKARQFQVHEAIIPGSNVPGISKGRSTKNDGNVELRGANDSANRSDFPGSAAVNQKVDTEVNECIRSPGYDAMISTDIRMGEEAKKQYMWDNLIPFKVEAEKLPISDLQNDHDDSTKIGLVKDVEDVKLEKGFDKSQQVHVTDHGSPTKKTVEQKGANDLADRRDIFPSSVEDKEEKLYKTNHQNHLNEFLQEALPRDSPDVNMERGSDESESFHTSNDDLATKTYVRKEEQARTKDAADKSDYLHIVEGKEEKFYKTHYQTHIMYCSQNSMKMRSDESYLHVSDNESDIRRDMRMEEQADTKDIAEKSGRLHIPAEGKEENFQKSNQPDYQYDLPTNVPIRDASNAKMEKAFHESEHTHISDDSSAIKEERTEELAVKVAPHESRSMSSSCDSSISKDVRDGQQVRRINFADKFAAFTSKEGRSFSNDLLQVIPSGATLDGTLERGSNEDVHTMNPPHHDSIFLEDTKIQLEKLDYDPSNSQNYLKNIEVKDQGSTPQKSTPEKLDQSEDIRASSSSSGISITMNDKGRKKVGDDHHLNIAVGSATGNFSEMNGSKQSDDLPAKMDFKNKIESGEQNNEFSHNFIQAKQDGNFQQSNWHNQLETHSARVQVKDIPKPVPDDELEEWESILDNLPSVLSDYKRDDLQKDELPDQGNGEDSRRRVFRTIHNELYTEQHESGIEDDQPNWRELFLNSLDDDREKILLEEYTSVLRNFKGVKMKLNDAEKKRRASHFQYVVQMKVLKNANALKDAQILSLQHRLNSLQSKDIETINFNEMPKEATLQAADMKLESTAPEDRRISDIGEDGGDIKVTDVDEAQSFTTVEEKVRMDIDDLLEENIELWLRFSTSFHQLHKFQTSVQDLQDELNKVREERKQDTGQPRSLLSGIRPIYRHLREIHTELTLWLDHNAVLKDDLQNRLSSLSNILDVITRLSRSKENEPVLNAYQAAKFQGEILNMRQENNKLAGELELGIECIRKLQNEIQSTLSNLDEELGLKKQPARPRSKIPLRSFLFGVKLKRQRPSIFSCVNPALQKQYSDL
ncbi:protein NETWORKED 2A-like isoform X2 [Solanum dulcamara]|uniref:protein NETWORKED 2A-like isoform X2 n=1 Tax=Solanum dulcamara TaxID=45834 RepID=UPI0024868EA1|nr:protein NETWORKED 2A-like isoform X2 [Solanum dulcamara]